LFSVFLFFLFAFCVISPVFAQTGILNPLAAEISGLERTSLSAPSLEQRYEAFLGLTRLYRLLGNSEAALSACQGALAVSPGDSRALLEQSRLLISMGEFEKAAVALAGIKENAALQEGRYLNALLIAFYSGDTLPLASLANASDFSEYRSAIYYTLWKFGELLSWRTRLIQEFPFSPEAKIAMGNAASSVTPLWLFSQARGVTFSQPVAAPTQASSGGVVLQTGIFGNEENARALAERLKKAGFEPEIFTRLVNGSFYWAVGVSGGTNMNEMIGKLSAAGFDSFPVERK
jgi:tetratricopeptide (TPR) repeat protein